MGFQGTISPNYEWFAQVWMLQLAGALQLAQALERAVALQWAVALQRALPLQRVRNFAAGVLNAPGEAGYPC